MKENSKQKIEYVIAEVDKFLDLFEKTGKFNISEKEKIEELLQSAISSFKFDSEEDKELRYIGSYFRTRIALIIVQNGEFSRQVNNAKVVSQTQLKPIYDVMSSFFDDAIKNNSKYKDEYIEIKKSNIEDFNSELAENGISVQNGGCYIATAVYGSYDCPQVWTLRRYRDKTMSKNIFGRLFIRIYYSISPTMVKLFGDKKWFIRLFRASLDKIVNKLKRNGYEDTPYGDYLTR